MIQGPVVAGSTTTPMPPYPEVSGSDNPLLPGALEWHSPWKADAQRIFACETWLHPDETGGYWVEVPRLPGANSEGETIEEALVNIGEALAGVIESYLEDGPDVPWTEIGREPDSDVVRKWVLVNV